MRGRIPGLFLATCIAMSACSNTPMREGADPSHADVVVDTRSSSGDETVGREDEHVAGPCGPLVTGDCKPSCAGGRECGADGCGGHCGFCDPGSTCDTAEGKCLCEASCVGKVCGPDGCGGTCGQCEANKVCSGTVCVLPGTMLTIPAGTFWMGCNGYLHYECLCDFDPLPCSPGPSSACPYHPVSVPEYEISVTEATTKDFASFLNENGDLCGDAECLKYAQEGMEQTAEGWTVDDEYSEFPLRLATWFGARDYCIWKGGRLCTEAEWEKAARGGCEFYSDCEAEGRDYPWGYSDPGQDKCAGCDSKEYAPVGSFPNGASPYGVLDMAGNADEWVQDCYASDYLDAFGDGSAHDEAFCPESEWGAKRRGVRGGNSSTGWDAWLRVYVRSSRYPDAGAGIRCCQ